MSFNSGPGKQMVEAIRQELQRYPVAFAFKYGGRHPYALITADDGRVTKLGFASSHSDHRAILNQRALVRRLMRTLGIEPRDRRFRSEPTPAEPSEIVPCGPGETVATTD